MSIQALFIGPYGQFQHLCSSKKNKQTKKNKNKKNQKKLRLQTEENNYILDCTMKD